MDESTLRSKTAHLAWCALVALNFARSEGQVTSAAQETIFICRWLSTALKQHRFCREVAPDITWLLTKGRTMGSRANLARKLNYLWHSCSGDILKQTDIFRATYALETAREMGWDYILTGRELERDQASGAVNLTNSNRILIARISLDTAFNESGGQIEAIMMKVSGEVAELKSLFDEFGFRLDEQSAMEGGGLMSMTVAAMRY